jgi:NitT/TauT family transport system substrate-binding protein
MRKSTSFAMALMFGSILATGAAQALEKITYQLGWIPSGERAQVYLAQDAGFFAEEGLEVRILPGKGGADALMKVATGSADLGETGLNSLFQAAISNEVPVKAIMAMHTQPVDALITIDGSGINSVKDLAGKKVATSAFTSSNVHWPVLLKANGVEPSAVNLVKADAASLVPLLATGQVDAIIMYYTNLPAVESVLSSTGKVVKALRWSDYGLAGYSNSVVTSVRFLKENRSAVVGFVRALKKAEELMHRDPARAAAAVKALVPEIDVAIMEATIKSSDRALFNENTSRDGLGVFSPELVKTTWQWVSREEGVPADKLDPSSMVDYAIAK